MTREVIKPGWLADMLAKCTAEVESWPPGLRRGREFGERTKAMTREELELRVSAALPNGCDSCAIIRPVIRLVVEACSKRLWKCSPAASVILEQAFLPTETPDA